MLLHETAREDGSLEAISLVVRGASIVLVDDRGEHPLPDGAIDAVMRRYGKPLEGRVPSPIETLTLPSGATLVRFRYLGVFDVIARDYIAYEDSEASETRAGEPICELATAVTAALSHLARAAHLRYEA